MSISDLRESYQNWEQWGGYLVMGRLVLVSVEHEKCEQGTEKTDAELAE